MANGISIRARVKADGKTVWDLRVRRKKQKHFETFFTKTAASSVGNKIAAQMDVGTFTPKGAISCKTPQTDGAILNNQYDQPDKRFAPCAPQGNMAF
jgi:hypothetical protein